MASLEVSLSVFLPVTHITPNNTKYCKNIQGQTIGKEPHLCAPSVCFNTPHPHKSALRNERFIGKGIPYIKVGRSVRYNLDDVIDFMESRKIETYVNY